MNYCSLPLKRLGVILGSSSSSRYNAQALSRHRGCGSRRYDLNGGRWFSKTTTTTTNGDDDDEDNPSKKTSATTTNDEWIPPNRPLAGDQGHSQLYQTQQAFDQAEEALFTISEEDSDEDILRKLEDALALEEALEKEQQDNHELESPPVADWLQTRRAALRENGDDEDENSIAILPHTLLTLKDLETLLTGLGGIDIMLLLDDPEAPRMGGSIGMLLCTASNPFHVTALTRALISHLKERQLQDLGVLGAQMTLRSSSAISSNTWNVVDCSNYMVHLFDQPTRQALKLEDLWTGKDPLWKLNYQDDDAVEDYVANHSVPPGFGPNPEEWFGKSSLTKLRHSKHLFDHRPVVPLATKMNDRKAGRKRRRRLRQQDRGGGY
jgi:ribosomal silencing factor RsfS